MVYVTDPMLAHFEAIVVFLIYDLLIAARRYQSKISPRPMGGKFIWYGLIVLLVSVHVVVYHIGRQYVGGLYSLATCWFLLLPRVHNWVNDEGRKLAKLTGEVDADMIDVDDDEDEDL